MNWRNPKKELPEDDQIVWCMLKPHKDRGNLLESAPSIEIVCGWVTETQTGIIVDNADELGHGCISWYLTKHPDGYGSDVLAWLPVTEMIFPDWTKK